MRIGSTTVRTGVWLLCLPLTEDPRKRGGFAKVGDETRRLRAVFGTLCVASPVPGDQRRPAPIPPKWTPPRYSHCGPSAHTRGRSRFRSRGHEVCPGRVAGLRSCVSKGQGPSGSRTLLPVRAIVVPDFKLTDVLHKASDAIVGVARPSS